MAVLTDEQLTKVRRKMAQHLASFGFDKPTVNAAIQEMEDWYESEKATVSSRLDTVTSPVVLTNAEKKAIGGAFLVEKALRELV